MNSKELAELIHQNTRIILPEFGAFLVKDGGEKGFNPSNVSFSPFLRYNDGMLEVYVAKSRGVSKEEASKDVRTFVEIIKNELLEKGVFEIEGLGQLKRDQRGSLSFSLDLPTDKGEKEKKVSTKSPSIKKEGIDEPTQGVENANDNKDAQLEKDKTTVGELKEAKTKKVSGSKAKVEKLITTKRPAKTTKKEVVEEQPIQENISEPVVESEPQQIPVDVSTPKVEIKTEEIIILKPEVVSVQKENNKSQETEKEIPTPSKKGKRGSSKLIYLGIAAVFLVFLVLLIRNYYFSPKIEPIDDSLSKIEKPKDIVNDKIDANDKIEKPKDDIDKAFNEISTNKTKSKEQIRKEKEQEDAIAKTLIKNAQSKEALGKAAEKRTSTGVKYYIIAGSFKNPDFAKKFLNELNNSGYTVSIVIQPSGMNAVTIGSYDSRDEANEAMKNFKNKLPNLWILKK